MPLLFYKTNIFKGCILSIIFQNELIKVEIEKSEIPWLKIFTQEELKEFSDCDIKTKAEILRALDIIEKEMIKYFTPKKINIASFGNYVPHVHFHIMARFEEDSYYPEPMWGVKQREANLKLPKFENFYTIIKNKL